MRLPLNATTIDVARTLSQQKHFVWLDSAIKGRYSFLAANPVTIAKDAEALKKLFSNSPNSKIQWIGYLTYEAHQLFGQIPFQSKFCESPIGFFAGYETFVVIDHHRNESWIESPTPSEAHNLLNVIQQTHQDLQEFNAGNAQAHTSKEAYTRDFNEIIQAIESGTFYEINYSQKFSGHFSGNPLALYLKLRSVSPAPFMAYLNCGEQVILSASPECFFDWKDHHIRLFPIKGTSRRGQTEVEDKNLQSELLNNPKECAELLMITDLLRNDLGHFCKPGSIQVTDLRRIESFSHYHHLVSEITGTTPEHITLWDVLAALFPGGSITGAPKIKAMEYIDRLEGRSRGVYCGAIGHFAQNHATFNIPIRTITIAKGTYSFATGGGIVADSKCDSEFEECLVKARGLLQSLTDQS